MVWFAVPKEASVAGSPSHCTAVEHAPDDTASVEGVAAPGGATEAHGSEGQGGSSSGGGHHSSGNLCGGKGFGVDGEKGDTGGVGAHLVGAVNQ